MVRIAAMPDDTQFPQLQVVTDCVAMKDVFQRQLPGFASLEAYPYAEVRARLAG